MDSIKRKFKFLAECAGWGAGIAWLIAFSISPVPDPHSESRWKFYIAHIIFGAIMFSIIFIIGTIFIIIKRSVTHITSGFQKRSTD